MRAAAPGAEQIDGVDAVDARHIHVHDGDVRRMLLHLRHQRGAVVHHGGDLDLREFLLHQQPQRLALDLLVVGDDKRIFHSGSPFRISPQSRARGSPDTHHRSAGGALDLKEKLSPKNSFSL